MASLKNYSLLLLLLFYFLHYPFSYGQSSKKYQIIVKDNIGVPVKDFNFSILGVPSKVTDSEGKASASLPANLTEIPLEDVQIESEDMFVKSISIKENTIRITVQNNFYDIEGLVIAKNEQPVSGATVSVPNLPSVTPVKTDGSGNFTITVPSTFELSFSSEFEVNGVKKGSSDIKYYLSSNYIVITAEANDASSKIEGSNGNSIIESEDKKLIIHTLDNKPVVGVNIYLSEKEYTTDEQGETIAKVPKYGTWDVVVEGFIVNRINYPNTPEDPIKIFVLGEGSQLDTLVSGYVEDFDQVLEELENEKLSLTEKSLELQAQIEQISKRLESEQGLTPEQKLTLRASLNKLETQLLANEQAFQEAQDRSRDLIDNMRNELAGADSIKIAQQELIRKQEEERAKLAAEKEKNERAFRQNLIIISSISILAIALAVIFFMVSKRIKKQNIEIANQAENLKELHEESIRQNASMTDSIRYAKTIQAAVLPDINKIDEALPQHFIMYKPKDIVSGDFYWFSHILPQNTDDSEKIYIAAIDCTGHGVPGAFMSMLGTAYLNEIVNQKKIYSTSAILESLNQSIIRSLKQTEKGNDDGMDVSLCMLEKLPEGQVKLTYTGAKRPLLYTRSSEKKVEILAGDRKSIGGYKQKPAPFTEQSLTLSKGDCLYLSTDGFIDQNGDDNMKFGTKRFLSLIEEVCPLSIKEQEEVFNQTLIKHQQSKEQRDDITVIGIRL